MRRSFQSAPFRGRNLGMKVLRQALALGVLAAGASIALPGGPAQAAETAQDAPLGEGAEATPDATGKKATADTFEALLATAQPSVDLGTLIAPFVEDCEGARREIDKARCRGTVAFLKRTMPGRSYAAIVPDAETRKPNQTVQQIRASVERNQGRLREKQSRGASRSR